MARSVYRVLGSISRIMMFGVSLYLLLVLLVYGFQERLIFFPHTYREAPRIVNQRAEEIHITAADGVTLHGWFVSNSEDDRNVVFYFGGNAEELSFMTNAVRRYDGWSFVLINYRGYGLSEGKPGEAFLYQDALEVYDHIMDRINDSLESRVIFMGRSLGSGVAVYLAAERPSSGVILISPYDSLTRVAQRAYPFLPVRFLLRHRFDSIQKAPKLDTPLHMIIASEDTVIPPDHSKRLAEEWGGEVLTYVIEEADHNTLGMMDAYWDSLQQILDVFEQSKPMQ